LRHPLDQEYAGHDRLARKMAHEMRLVDSDILDADAELIAPNVAYPVDHQERIAVRQRPHDFAYVGRFKRFDLLVHWRSALRAGSGAEQISHHGRAGPAYVARRFRETIL
jgi:hypothetical protein